MSDIFAEATVRVSPSLTRFVTDLDGLLKIAMGKVKPPVVRVRPALTVDFVGDLRKQVNAAILQAQKGIKPIRIAAIVDTPTGKPITITGTGAPAGGGGATRAVSETTRLSQAQKALTATSDRLAGIENKLLLETTELGRARARLRETMLASTTAERAVAASAETTDAALKKQAVALQRDIQLKVEDAAATVRLAEANRTAASAVSQGIPARPQTVTRARTAGVSGLRTTVESMRETDVLAKKLIKDNKDLGAAQTIAHRRATELAGANRAVTASLRAESDTLRVATSNTQRLAKINSQAASDEVKATRSRIRESTKQARSSEQLSRGGQASLLSLAGIRGATLAASRSFLVGAAAITVFAKAVKSFADLETNLDVFQATASATAEEMERVREASVKLGADLTLPSVSAGDAAGAMVELAKAGLSVQGSIEGARGVLQLATAAAIDNAQATQIVANALNAFELAGRDAAHVADVFANAANAAQGSIADIGTAFQQAAAAGRQVGLSFEDTSVFLTILAKNGLRGSDAGTSLRTALIRLVNPSKEAAAKFKELGIQVRDAAGNLRPDVFLQIADATSKLSPAARDAAFALIGGQDAFRAITILGRQSIASFIAMRRALREQGTAAEVAAARTKGLHGALDGLASVLETVGTNIGASVGPGLATFTRGLGTGVLALSESDEVAKTLSETLAALGQGFNLLGDAASAIGPPVLAVSRGLLNIANAIGINTILAGVAAYKLLPAAFGSITAAVTRARLAIHAFEISQGLSIRSGAGLKTALRGVATSFNIYAIAAAAATAGIIFFLTRESEAERATRHLTEATRELGKALSDVAAAQSEQVISTRSVNQAVADIDSAKKAAATAKQTLENSKAAKGTSERRRHELALAIAIDNVAIAEQRASDATRAANEARGAADAASLRRDDARKKEQQSIKELIGQQLAATRLNLRGPVSGQSAADAEVRARENIIKKLNEQGEASRRSDDAGERAAGKRLQAIAKLANALGRLPSQHEIEVFINSTSVGSALKKLEAEFKRDGNQAGATAVQSILLQFGLLPDKLKNFIDARRTYEEIFVVPAGEAGENAAKRFLEAFRSAMAASQGRLAGAEVQENLATISSGATGATLPALRAQLAEFNRQRNLAETRIAKSGETPQLRKLRREAIAGQARVIEQIRSINEQLANDAEAAANQAAQDSADATQAFLDQFQARRQKLENKITTAGLSAGLDDDIRANKVLIQFFKKRIELIRKRIRDMKLHGDALKAAQTAIAAFGQDIFNTRAEIANLTQQQAEARHDLVLERFDLRIQIAESRGNLKAQLRAHRAKLEEITRELVRVRRQYGRNSIEWLRLKAAQAEEIAAIKELEDQAEEKKDAFRSLQFEFLQAQQGFAANLLGNLFPINPVSLGGGGQNLPTLVPQAPSLPGPGQPGPGRPGSGIDRGLAKVGAVQGAETGATAGQLATLIEINKAMLKVLQALGLNTKHPEANHASRASRQKAFGAHR